MVVWHEGSHRCGCRVWPGAQRARHIRAFGDAGYRAIEKRPDTRVDVTWHIACTAGAAAPKWPEKAANQSPYAPKFGENDIRVSSNEIFNLNSRNSGGCADLI